jgi:cytochrome c
MNNFKESIMFKKWAIVVSLIMLPLSFWTYAMQEEAGEEISIETVEDVDINRKSKECKQLVQNGIKHFQRVSIAQACNDFIHNAVWRKGEIFVYVYKEDGSCLAHGDDHDLIWKNIRNVKGIGGAPLIKDMITTGQKGGRISFLWNNGFQSAYVKTIKKNGSTYVLGAGFYPESDEYQTKQLVKTAVSYFYQNGREATFSLINNPTGPFVKGDIYMFVYDFQGVNVAHGQNAALVGTNLLDLQDSRGKLLIREIIKAAREKGSGWVEYYWRNEFKRSYLEKVIDPKTKTPYVIAAGYHPNINLAVVKSYVRRAIRFLKANGSKVAFAEFSNLVGEFAQGGLGIFVFDFNGKNLANGENPAFVGQNLLKVRGKGGRFYIKDMIETAKKYGSGLISYVTYNANAVAWVERVETPDGKFVIGAEFFPASKSATTQTLVNRALTLFREQPAEAAFDKFSSRDSVYMRGDLSIFVYDQDGTRMVNGPFKSQIWKNLLKATDQQGKSVINDIITIAVNGGGWAEYKTRNATRKVYVKSLEKKIGNTTHNFIIGSGYFL